MVGHRDPVFCLVKVGGSLGHWVPLRWSSDPPKPTINFRGRPLLRPDEGRVSIRVRHFAVAALFELGVRAALSGRDRIELRTTEIH